MREFGRLPTDRPAKRAQQESDEWRLLLMASIALSQFNLSCRIA